MTTNDALVPAPDWPMLHGDNDGLFGAVLMSNFDHEVDQVVAQQLKTGMFKAEYTGLNFHAMCWHADGEFYAEVSTHHLHRATLHALTPEKLMRLVCEEFGDD